MSSRFSKAGAGSVQGSESLKQLKLKSGALKRFVDDLNCYWSCRLTTELKSYLKEKKENEDKLIKMIASHEDQHNCKKQVLKFVYVFFSQEEFVQESTLVLAATRQNFVAAYEILLAYIVW